MLREFIEKIDKKGIIKCIERPLSIKYEIAIVMKKFDGIPLLFKKVTESPQFRIISGIAGNRNLIREALNIKQENLYEKIIHAAENPKKPKEVSDAPFLKNTKDTLKELPILTHYENDGGPYITAALVYARDTDTDTQNVSFHRMMVIDDRHLAIRIVPRHLFTIFKKNKEKGKDTPVTIVIGVHPAVLISAAYPLEFGMDETWMANSLLDGKLEVISSPINNIEVPSHSEIIIEGFIDCNKEVDEGPFVDITGSYDKVRKQPIIEVEKVYFRENPIYHAILPAGEEHKILMGMPREVKIWSFVKQVVPEVKEVSLTSGGCGWLHAVISIKKHTEGDPKNAIIAAFAAHPSLKHCVVVDDDIDVHNPSDVEWAIATRFQASEDLIIINNVRGSSLDPSADQETLITTKVGIDATIPLSKRKEDFIKAKPPAEIERKILKILNKS
ncbi:MAG: UbiD family decarboxylase [Candidatus Asgardarchaeum sp.]